MKAYLQNSLYKKAHSSLIHTSPKVEIVQIPINKKMDKLNCILTIKHYSAIKKKKQTNETCNNMDEFQNTILNKGSKTKENVYYMISCI